MEEQPRIIPSANKHGVGDEDLLHGYRNHIHIHTQDDGMVMMIGSARDGELIEVGLIEYYGEWVIAHGFRPARSKYLR